MPFYVYKKQRDSYRFIVHIGALLLYMCGNRTDCDSLAVYFWKFCIGKKI